jgi:ATP-dependent DNA helicase RecG
MRAMISARELGAINNTSFRSLNRDCDTLSASKHLRKLVDCGLLMKKGGGPTTYYTPTEKALANWPPLVRKRLNSAKFDLEPIELDLKKQELDPKKQELDPKGDPTEISKLVLEILAIRPMTNAELANHLGRKPDYVRRTFIKPLLAQGHIRSSNPENPTDPNLKYSAIRDR